MTRPSDRTLFIFSLLPPHMTPPFSPPSIYPTNLGFPTNALPPTIHLHQILDQTPQRKRTSTVQVRACVYARPQDFPPPPDDAPPGFGRRSDQRTEGGGGGQPFSFSLLPSSISSHSLPSFLPFGRRKRKRERVSPFPFSSVRPHFVLLLLLLLRKNGSSLSPAPKRERAEKEAEEIFDFSAKCAVRGP